MNGTRALILDFGGVVTKTLFETHEETEQALGLPAGTLTWKGPFDPGTDSLWEKMQRRELTERDYWHERTREVGALVGETWTEMRTFVQRARGADPKLVVRPEADETIRAAKAAGCKLAILSNELDLFYGESFRQRLPLLELFDVIVDATYTGILKPNPEAYEMVLSALGVLRKDCVFVDDQSTNIEGAEAVNLPHVHFDVTRPTDSYAMVRERLGI